MNKYTRKIVKNGRNSYYVNIPKEMMKELRWREKQKVVVNLSGKGVNIKDWKK